MSDIHTRSSIPLPPDAEGPMPTPAEEFVSAEPAIASRFAQGDEGYFALVWRRFRRSVVGMISLADLAMSLPEDDVGELVGAVSSAPANN